MKAVAWCLFALVLGGPLRPQDPGPAEPAPRRTSFQAAVNAAVERGVVWLRLQQDKVGHWQHAQSPTYPMGVTALCALALLRSDVLPEDPAILRALEALKYLPFDKTYSTGLMLMVLEAVKNPDRHREWAKRGADFLITNQHANGLWAYPQDAPDLSNSQFAVFGLFAASRMGVPVARDPFLRFSRRALLNLQESDGGFKYTADSMISGSMTAAGIASLLLCRQLSEKQKLGLPVKEIDAACDKGFGWLAKRFRADQNPTGPTDAYQPNQPFYFYYLYAVERAAVLGGKVKLGDHDWYREGAIKLIRKQDAAGHWEDVVNTSFALLFLKRASLTYSPHAKEFEGDPKLLLPIEDEAAPVDEALKTIKIEGSVPFLRDWIVLGPFLNLEDKLLNEDLINEGKILPHPTLRTGKHEWKEWRSEKDFVDLDLAISQAGNVIGYACCYLWADADTEGVLWFGSDEGAKVMLNRETVLYEHRHDQTGPDTSRVRVKLKKGRNILIVKVEELKYYWGFAARLTDMSGRALALKTTLRPEK